MHNITTDVVTITPKIALEWLGKMKFNRPLNTRNVDYLVKQMREGKWRVANDSICFDADGNLMNGQHRLTAVIKYGGSVDMTVTRGLNMDAFNVMDTGRNRKASDVIGSYGHPNANAISAIASFVMYYKRGFIANKDTKKHIDNADILKFVNDNPKIFDIYAMTISVTRKFKALTNRHIAGLYWIFSEIDKDDADRFFEAYSTGLNLSKTNPIYILREKLIADMGSNKKYSAKDKIAFAIIAWNTFRENKEMKSLRYNSQNEVFPKPI